MTWWINEIDGRVELRDDDKLVALFYSSDDAHEVLGLHDLTMRQSALLTGVVNAVRGEPPNDTLWSHHDAPAITAAAMAQLNRFVTFARLVRGMFPVYVETANTLIAELSRFEDSLKSVKDQGAE